MDGIEGNRCELCSKTLEGKRPRLLYGYPVCARCIERFANRRQMAFLVDFLLSGIVAFPAASALAFLLRLLGFHSLHEQIRWSAGFGLIAPLSAASFVGPAFWVLKPVHPVYSAIAVFVFLCKDSWQGRSLGKALLGLRTVATHRSRGAGLLESIKRNLPTLIPLAIFPIGLQLLRGGHRLGDQWAGTSVVSTRHSMSRVFKRGADANATE